jgi:DNA topoisomerase-1
VAKRLGNTPVICRKCYVHPEVIASYIDGTLLEATRERAGKELSEDLHALRPEEAAVLAFLQERMRAEAAK